MPKRKRANRPLVAAPVFHAPPHPLIIAEKGGTQVLLVNMPFALRMSIETQRQDARFDRLTANGK